MKQYISKLYFPIHPLKIIFLPSNIFTYCICLYIGIVSSDLPPGELHTTRYGKLNFKNQAGKEVKIYEVSGIGEPTILSKNYISTFYVKSPKLTARFKAEDAQSKDTYMLNGEETYEIHLSDNPRTETDVIITKPDAALKRAHEPSK